jgi:hypothetical protein
LLRDLQHSIVERVGDVDAFHRIQRYALQVVEIFADRSFSAIGYSSWWHGLGAFDGRRRLTQWDSVLDTSRHNEARQILRLFLLYIHGNESC